MRRQVHPCRSIAQQGAALLIVLLVTAIASVVALGISERLALDLARTETMLLNVRGTELSAGLEALAGRLLEEDNEQEPEYDYSGSLWANPLPGLPVPGGLVTGSLESLDGRFNLNSLLDASGAENTARYQQFQRLLLALDMPVSIADTMLDWLDNDPLPRAQGAEDEHYRQLDPPYLTANQPFSHISELRLVAGVTPEAYQRLLPHVTVLPADSQRARVINVNLASVPVLQSLHDVISRQRAESLYQQGRAQYTSVAVFLDSAVPELQDDALTELEATVGVRSNFFLARADVMLNDRPQRYFALLERRGNQYHVHYRSFATP